MRYSNVEFFPKCADSTIRKSVVSFNLYLSMIIGPLSPLTFHVKHVNVVSKSIILIIQARVERID